MFVLNQNAQYNSNDFLVCIRRKHYIKCKNIFISCQFGGSSVYLACVRDRERGSRGSAQDVRDRVKCRRRDETQLAISSLARLLPAMVVRDDDDGGVVGGSNGNG